jgi:hypothetical protein
MREATNRLGLGGLLVLLSLALYNQILASIAMASGVAFLLRGTPYGRSAAVAVLVVVDGVVLVLIISKVVDWRMDRLSSGSADVASTSGPSHSTSIWAEVGLFGGFILFFFAAAGLYFWVAVSRAIDPWPAPFRYSSRLLVASWGVLALVLGAFLCWGFVKRMCERWQGRM